MTDQTIPDVTDDELELAREWAASVESYADSWTERIRAAARVILHAIPSPPRPTLADMTPEERAACQWMQADIIGGDEPLVITRIDRTDGTALILDRNGRLDGVPAEHVTPRPDLPRFVWPGDQKPAPALPEGWQLADHEKRGRVIVTNTIPDAHGHVYFMAPTTSPLGSDRGFCPPAALTYLDGPESPTPARVGDTIESADDPRIAALPVGTVLLDRDRETVAKRGEAWEGIGYIPIPYEGDEYGPWTVRRIGNGDDQ